MLTFVENPGWRTATDAFALFIFCLDSKIQRECVAAMAGDDETAAKQWAPMIAHTRHALEALQVLRGVPLFRSRSTKAGAPGELPIPMDKNDLRQILIDYPVRSEMCWPSFSVATTAIDTAAGWRHKIDDHEPCGVIFKILTKNSARSVKNYTYSPWLDEVVLMPAKFRVHRQ